MEAVINLNIKPFTQNDINYFTIIHSVLRVLFDEATLNSVMQ